MLTGNTALLILVFAWAVLGFIGTLRLCIHVKQNTGYHRGIPLPMMVISGSITGVPMGGLTFLAACAYLNQVKLAKNNTEQENKPKEVIR